MGAAPRAGVAARQHLAPRSSPALAVLALTAAAWLGTVLLELTGGAGVLHHHALIEGEPGALGPPPLWIAIPLFLVAWQLMIAAMMLPGSLRAIGAIAASPAIRRPGLAVLGFLGAYSAVWTGFGLAAFAGDMGLHRLVDATPWLAERPWVIQAATLALAGAWQLLPMRRRALQACRHPTARTGTDSSDAAAGFRIGLRYGLDCLVCSWALMLLMFAAGFANLGWMLILAAVMAYEALGRHGARFGAAAGAALVLLGLVAASGVVIGF